MPIQALSIFACLPDAQALNYLQTQYGFTRQVSLGKLAQAKRKYGKPMPRAGHPEIQDIPSEYTTYLERVKSNPRFIQTTGNGNIAYAFKLVEIDPLLAFQLHVSLEHAQEKVGLIETETTMEQILQECLPISVDDTNIPIGGITWHQEEGKCTGATLSFPGLNTRLLGVPQIIPVPQQKLLMLGGLFMGVGSPLVQIAQFEGRCFLKNGYHRAYRLRMAGITHIPAILLEAKTLDDVGLTQPGFLPMSVMKSSNPPTVGHFTNDRAYGVQTKRVKRSIHFSWRETWDDDE